MKTTINLTPNRLRRLREHAGMSLRDLEAASGVPYKTLWGWENGRVSRPHPRNAARVLAALDGTTTPPRLPGMDPTPAPVVRTNRTRGLVYALAGFAGGVATAAVVMVVA